MSSTKRDAPGEPVRDERHAYAAAVSGDALFIPTGEILVPSDAATGTSDDRAGASTSTISPARANATLVALAVAAFLVVTNEVAPMGLLKPMSEDLGRSESEIAMTSTVFALAVMFATLPLARLTTHLIRRWVIVGTLLFFTAGALTAAMAETYSGLLTSRVLTGMAHALFWAVVTPAAAGMFPAANRGKSVARLLLGASAAGVIGLPAETYLAQKIDWQAPFWVLSVGGAILAVTIALLMPSFRTQQSTLVLGEVPSRPRFVRIMGVTLLTTAAMSLTWTFFSPLVTDVTGFADSTVPILLFVGGVVGVATTWMVARYLDRWPVRSVVIGQALLAIMWLGLSLGVHNKAVVIAMICLQSLAWSVLVAAMVNWALRHTPWTSDLGNGAYATVFNAGNAVGSRAGALMVAAWSAQWLPVASLGLTLAALAMVLTVGGAIRPTLRKVAAARSGRIAS